MSGWTDAAKDRWVEENSDVDLSRDTEFVTHVVEYHPYFRVRVGLPPWLDPDEWFAQLVADWNDWLCDAGECWTEPAGEALVEVENEGSESVLVTVEDGDR